MFVTVADCGSLAGAARKLALSPPTVTRIVNELERHIGAALLHRSTRVVALTETGATYLADARRILDDVRAADAAAQGARMEPRGTLRLTASVLFGQNYIAPIVGELLDRHPEMSVDAVFLDRTVNVIEEGFDVAVRIGPLPDSSLRAIRVGAVRHVVCASPAYLARHGKPRHPRDLAEHRLIAFEGRKTSWRFDDGVTVRIAPRMTFNTIAPGLAMARAGWGLTRALSYQVGPDIAGGRLVTVLDAFSTTEWPVHLLHAEPHGPSAKLRAFLDLAVERLRALPALST